MRRKTRRVVTQKYKMTMTKAGPAFNDLLNRPLLNDFVTSLPYQYLLRNVNGEIKQYRGVFRVDYDGHVNGTHQRHPWLLVYLEGEGMVTATKEHTMSLLAPLPADADIDEYTQDAPDQCKPLVEYAIESHRQLHATQP